MSRRFVFAAALALVAPAFATPGAGAHGPNDDGPAIAGRGVVSAGCAGHLVEFQGFHLGANQWRFVFDRISDDGQCTPLDAGSVAGHWDPPHGNSGPSGRKCVTPSGPSLGVFCLAWVPDSSQAALTAQVSFSLNGVGGLSEGLADVARFS